MFPSKTALVTQVIRTVVLAGGELNEISSSPDGSSTRLAYIVEDGARGRLSGRLAVWLTGDQERIIVITGTWPAEQDKDMTPIFEAIAASARFE